jgi:hypothetical protein
VWVYEWALSQKEHNRVAHALNGNVLSRKARNRLTHALNGNIKGKKKRSTKKKVRIKATRRTRSTSRPRGKVSKRTGMTAAMRAPVSTSRGYKNQEAKILQRAGGVCVSNSEYVEDVKYHIPDYSGQSWFVEEYKCAPGLLEESVPDGHGRLFTWLCGTANSYEYFTVSAVSFIYEPFTGTNSQVSIAMAWDPDPTNGPPDNERDMLAMKFSQQYIAWREQTLTIPSSAIHRLNRFLYVRNSATAADLRWSDFGSFYLAVVGGKAKEGFPTEPETYGKLHVRYTFEFYNSVKPTLLRNPANASVLGVDDMKDQKMSTYVKLGVTTVDTLQEGVAIDDNGDIVLAPGVWQVACHSKQGMPTSVNMAGEAVRNTSYITVDGVIQPTVDHVYAQVPPAFGGVQTVPVSTSTTLTVPTGSTKSISGWSGLFPQNPILGNQFNILDTVWEVVQLIEAAADVFGAIGFLSDAPEATGFRRRRTAYGRKLHEASDSEQAKEAATQIIEVALADEKKEYAWLRGKGEPSPAIGFVSTPFVRYNIPGQCLVELGYRTLTEIETEDDIWLGCVEAKNGDREMHCVRGFRQGFIQVTNFNSGDLLKMFGEPGATTNKERNRRQHALNGNIVKKGKNKAVTAKAKPKPGKGKKWVKASTLKAKPKPASSASGHSGGASTENIASISRSDEDAEPGDIVATLVGRFWKDDKSRKVSDCGNTECLCDGHLHSKAALTGKARRVREQAEREAKEGNGGKAKPGKGKSRTKTFRICTIQCAIDCKICDETGSILPHFHMPWQTKLDQAKVDKYIRANFVKAAPPSPSPLFFPPVAESEYDRLVSKYEEKKEIHPDNYVADDYSAFFEGKEREEKHATPPGLDTANFYAPLATIDREEEVEEVEQAEARGFIWEGEFYRNYEQWREVHIEVVEDLDKDDEDEWFNAGFEKQIVITEGTIRPNTFHDTSNCDVHTHKNNMNNDIDALSVARACAALRLQPKKNIVTDHTDAWRAVEGPQPSPVPSVTPSGGIFWPKPHLPPPRAPRAPVHGHDVALVHVFSQGKTDVQGWWYKALGWTGHKKSRWQDISTLPGGRSAIDCYEAHVRDVHHWGPNWNLSDHNPLEANAGADLGWMEKQYVNHLADLGLNLWRETHVYCDLVELIKEDQYYQVREALDGTGKSYTHFKTAVRQIATNLMKDQGPVVKELPLGMNRDWYKDAAVFEDTLAYCIGQAMIRDRRANLLNTTAVSMAPCFRSGPALARPLNSAGLNAWEL